MATKWHFRSTTAAAGPTGEVSTDTDDFPSVPSDKNTALNMTVGLGSSQTSVSGVYNNAGSNKMSMARLFVGPPLDSQTLTGSQAGYEVGVGIEESSVQMNLQHRIFVYVWRSGSGNVKTIAGPTSCSEHGAGEYECVISFSGNSGDFSIAVNDRIVVECWFDIPNTKSTDYTATLYYEGTDATMTDGTSTSDAGSYFYCPQTLTLYSLVKPLSGSVIPIMQTCGMI